MKIAIYPKVMLENAWQNDKKQLSADSEHATLCLRCGKPLDNKLDANSLSRQADIYICNCCGMDETLRDAYADVLPLTKWHAVVSGRIIEYPQVSAIILTPTRSFEQVYNDNIKSSTGLTERPASELVYSRSDHDRYRWWTTWFNCKPEKPTPQQIKEIDQFVAALFKLPEFKDYDSMVTLCYQYAQPTSSDTEYNLYAETEHFYIWLRLITRFRDYNLYTHFYIK